MDVFEYQDTFPITPECERVMLALLAGQNWAIEMARDVYLKRTMKSEGLRSDFIRSVGLGIEEALCEWITLWASAKGVGVRPLTVRSHLYTPFSETAVPADKLVIRFHTKDDATKFKLFWEAES